MNLESLNLLLIKVRPIFSFVKANWTHHGACKVILNISHKQVLHFATKVIRFTLSSFSPLSNPYRAWYLIITQNYPTWPIWRKSQENFLELFLTFSPHFLDFFCRFLCLCWPYASLAYNWRKTKHKKKWRKSWDFLQLGQVGHY